MYIKNIKKNKESLIKIRLSYCFLKFSFLYSAGEIASTGQTSTQEPQSVHASGSIT